MKTRQRWLSLAILLCVVTTVAIALPSTLAFIFSLSNTVHNSFRIEYLPPKDITVPVSVKKTVLYFGDEEVGPGGFSFRLMNLNTGESTAMTTLSNGEATLNLTFTAEDVGQTYRYRLFELAGDRQYMTYDETIHEIAISLRLNDVHEMVADLTLNGEPVTEIVGHFVNIYEPVQIPPTGDHVQPLLWLIALLFCGATFMLLCSKMRLARRP